MSVIKVDLTSGDIGEKIREGFGMILVDFGGISLGWNGVKSEYFGVTP